MASINRQALLPWVVLVMVVSVLLFGLLYTPDGYYVTTKPVPDFQFQNVTITHYKWDHPVWEIEADRASVWRLSSQLVGEGLRVTMWGYPMPLVVSAVSGKAQLDTFALRLLGVSGRYEWGPPLLFDAHHLEWAPSVLSLRLRGKVTIRHGGVRMVAGKVVMNMATHTMGVYDHPEVTVL